MGRALFGRLARASHQQTSRSIGQSVLARRVRRGGSETRPDEFATYSRGLSCVLLAFIVALHWAQPGFAELSADLKQQLAASTYVYVASQRKDGNFGKAAEIWFMYYQDAVWVGTPVTTWRVKRLKAGRTTARIAVGKPDGPSFEAAGTVVADAAAQAAMFETFAKKYPDGWKKYEQRFRDGFKDGSRVLIRYTPK